MPGDKSDSRSLESLRMDGYAPVDSDHLLMPRKHPALQGRMPPLFREDGLGVYPALAQMREHDLAAVVLAYHPANVTFAPRARRLWATLAEPPGA